MSYPELPASAMTARTRARLLALFNQGAPEACWPWRGRKKDTGYGKFAIKLDGRFTTILAHRAVYLFLVGPIGVDLQLDHLCRKTDCVNPAHLEPVTALENTARSNVGWENRAKTLCPRGHIYDTENTSIQPRENGRTSRRCLRCAVIRNTAYRQRKIAAGYARKNDKWVLECSGV